MEMIISVSRMKVHAFHGVLPQERIVGADFYVSVNVTADVKSAAFDNDELEGTVNYAEIANIISSEMAIPSNLIENVAKRIADRLLSELPTISLVEVQVEKENPPLGIQCEHIGVKLTQNR